MEKSKSKKRGGTILSITFDGKRTTLVLKGKFLAFELGDLFILVRKGSGSLRLIAPLENKESRKEKREEEVIFQGEGKTQQTSKRAGKPYPSESLEDLEEKEFDVLNKVSLIPFSRRDLRSVLLELSSEERKILKSLASRGFFKLYEKDGKIFLSFDERVYEKLKDLSKIKRENKNFISNDFMIVAPAFVKKYLAEIDNSFVFTIDAKGILFAVKRDRAKQLYKKVTSILKKGELSLEEIAAKLNLKKEEALAVLKLMGEEGIIYEPSPNRYSLA